MNINNIIEKNINNLTPKKINDIALSLNIYLKDDETNIIYKYIYNDWKTLIYGNPQKIFEDLKTKLNDNNYLKIVNLYNDYKQKYKNYL